METVVVKHYHYENNNTYKCDLDVPMAIWSHIIKAVNFSQPKSEKIAAELKQKSRH